MAKEKQQNEREPADELAAPAVLRQLQRDAAKYSKQVLELESRLDALRSISPNHSDSETEEAKAAMNRVDLELSIANKNWRETAKMLLPYDKGVAVEKREGEKIGIAEAKEIFAQLMLSLDLALEQCAISSAQSAALCDSPERFYKEHAENWRAAKDGAIASALGDGVIPKWLVEK